MRDLCATGADDRLVDYIITIPINVKSKAGRLVSSRGIGRRQRPRTFLERNAARGPAD